MKVNSVALILGILILACLMITPVMAETLDGNLTQSGWASYNYVTTVAGNENTMAIDRLRINNVSFTEGTKTFIRWDNLTANTPSGFDANSPDSAQTSFTAWMFNQNGNGVPTTWEIGSGTIGYQRRFNPPPLATEIAGYQYLVWDYYNITGLTGDIMVEIRFNHTLLHNISISKGYGPIQFPPIGNAAFSNGNTTASGGLDYGVYTLNRDTPFLNRWNATKPSGIGITGWITKTPEGTAHASRTFITNPTGTLTYTSELTVSTADYYFAVPAEQIKICLYDTTGQWHNTSTLFNLSAGTPTPTPTPIAGAVYSITTSTDYVNISGTNTVTISSLTDPSLADLKFIHYGYSDSENADASFYEVGSTVHATGYTLIGGTWYGYDSADVDYNNAKGGIPNPATLKWDTTSGDKSLTVTLQNSAGDYTILYRTIHVGQGSQTLITTKAQAMDGTNGGTLGMVSMQIFNHNTQTWTNLSPNNGLGSIITPPNTVLSFYAQKAGFTNGSLLNQPARGDLTYQVPLFIGPTVGAGFVNYFVTVQDAQGYPLSGATIAITPDAGSTKTAVSSSSGSQIFNLTASKLHTYTIYKAGYQGQSGSFTTGTSAGSLTVKLSPLVTPTKTVVMPTGSWTVNPSYTPSGNMTGFWTPWVNVFTQMGADTSELPLLIAAMLICFCMAAGFGMGGILGGEVAMGFGAIFCVALGLIPIWVVLAIIILGFLFYGLKIGR